MRYKGIHTIADAAGLMGGPIAREIAGGLFLLTWVYVFPISCFYSPDSPLLFFYLARQDLVHDANRVHVIDSLATGSGFIGLAQGFKILANGKVCTVVWTFIAALCTAIVASIRTLGKLAILTWIGFASIFTAVFIVV